MATKYKAIIVVNGKSSKIVEAASLSALGTAIGAAIPADSRTDVEIVYEVTGPSSRRKA